MCRNQCVRDLELGPQIFFLFLYCSRVKQAHYVPIKNINKQK